jgi:hypothetical protein
MLDDLEKLRACYFVTKEDPSVFVTPSQPSHPKEEEENRRQWMLDKDFGGFAFAPEHLMAPYKAEKEANPPEKRSKVIAAKLFRHMTNFVASNHGWHKGTNLVPSNYLDVEITQDQIDLLNPTPRDVQVGAIVDQCAGESAKKVIAKRRIDIVSGNVNSYARVLNGAAQLDKIKTYNQLAASIAIIRKERDEKKEANKERKKQEEIEKAAKKADKAQKDAEELERLGPICMEHVAKGLDHVLSLKLLERKDILRVHFGITSGVFDGVDKSLYKMNKADTEVELCRLMQSVPAVLPDSVGTEDLAVAEA